MNTAFDSWLAGKLDAGLVDIKFAVISGKGVSVQAIKSDVLAAEGAISSGYLKPAPGASSDVPAHIAAFING